MMDILQFENKIDMIRRENEMKKYCKLNLSSRKHDSNMGERSTFAEFLFNNYRKLEESEMRVLVNKCLELQDVKEILLNYELNHFQNTQPTEMTLNTFIKTAKQIFERYHALESNFEDKEWILHESGSLHYQVDQNEVIFENTIKIVDYDSKTRTYITNLIHRLKSISINIKVNAKCKEDYKNKIMHIIISGVDTNIESTEIGL